MDGKCELDFHIADNCLWMPRGKANLWAAEERNSVYGNLASKTGKFNRERHGYWATDSKKCVFTHGSRPIK